MGMPMGRAGGAALFVLTPMALVAALNNAVAAPASRKVPRIPFAERFEVTQHGGMARAANSSITCRKAVVKAAARCTQARAGRGVNGDYEMFYTDVDKDPNTYNSSRAELRLPAGSRVSHARLYWGGNLRAGEQKPHKDNRRVLIAEPGGQYKEVLADTVTGHRTSARTDAFQASSDVTPLVRDSGSGSYTVAQINISRGRSTAGAWGGWTLVVAYENQREPLRHLALWDGFENIAPGRRRSVTVKGPRIPAGASGRVGLVAYDGDRGAGGDALSVGTDRRATARMSDSANPRNDVANSTITTLGRSDGNREPAYRNTLGYDSDVFDIKPALRAGGSRTTVRLGTTKDSFQAGALFLQTDARR
ncbi:MULTISPECIES: hypothetical protein [unclassified Streptomyces]|nr:hypothetical protein OG533_37910 [Streptomyces sp. NBC_01186]WSS45781.1 hypothetical protein OG220_38165 [Streptomyces sp. NBC_01187]